MQTIILLVIVVSLLFLGVALWRWQRRRSHKPSGGNAANTDSELESLYSLLGDNSGRMKK